jgi:CxxC motif-containing protein (DUF1111 family)
VDFIMKARLNDGLLPKLPFLLALSVALSGCSDHTPPWPDPEWTSFELGGPLPGLTAEELARWQEGYNQFTRIWTVEEGLGPAFNENSCNACHSDPTTGGTMTETDLHATALIHGTCDYLAEEGGGNLRRQMTDAGEAYYGTYREPVPPESAELGRYLPALLYGRGMMASIPEDAIFALEDPEDADGDGISGRAGRYPDGTLARFFRKAELATLHEIADKGLRRQMGITTPDNPTEYPIMGKPVPEEVDPTPDPEVGAEISEAITDFILFLSPPPTIVPATEERQEMAARGRRVFEDIGCTGCHTPVLFTGPNEVGALDRKPVWLWSDLLLHDMGPELADNCGRDAAPSEIRTEPLMGMRLKVLLLHNGETSNIRRAIELHGGEGAISRNRFFALPVPDQVAVERFLRTL